MAVPTLREHDPDHRREASKQRQVSWLLRDMNADLADAVQRSGGHVLGTVSRLSEALAVIATAPCDAALLDINLGHETAYFGAEMLQVREVPFAFLTGSEGDEIESRYAKIPVLRKPFSEMEIESCLRRLIWNGS